MSNTDTPNIRPLVYFDNYGLARVEIPIGTARARDVAHSAIMFELARREQKSGEHIITARHRMREYLKETPLKLIRETDTLLTYSEQP